MPLDMLMAYVPGDPPMLRPTNATDHVNLLSLKRADVIRCKISVPRDGVRHRWFFAMLSTVAEAEGCSTEYVLEWLKLRLRLFDIRWVDDVPLVRLGSISYAAMDETEFTKFRFRAVELICRELLGGAEVSVLNQMIDERTERRGA